MSELKKLREGIDEIDEEILNLLNKRARIVIDVARIKRKENARFYSPEREKEILQRLISMNKGPFPDSAIKPLFREILSASLSLEQPLKVAYFGPVATFTHLAAIRYFGSSASSHSRCRDQGRVRIRLFRTGRIRCRAGREFQRGRGELHA